MDMNKNEYTTKRQNKQTVFIIIASIVTFITKVVKRHFERRMG